MTVPSANTMDLNKPKLLDLSAPDLQNAVRILTAHEHALCRGDEDAADELLADLEPHLRRLNWDQNEWLRGLSGDLHMLNDEEVLEPNRQDREEYRKALLSASRFAEGNADAANTLLALLRKEQGVFTRGRVSFGRANAYRSLGFPQLALEFGRNAVRLEPDTPDYQPQAFLSGGAVSHANGAGSLGKPTSGLKTRRMVPFIQRHVRVIAAVLGIVPAVMAGDFLLLVTSLGFHWWVPPCGGATGRILLVLLVVLSTVFSLLYAFRLWANVQAYRKRGPDVTVMRRLIVSVDGLALLVLFAVWGFLALAGKPSALPLKLLGVVYAGGFAALVALRVYELRRKSRGGLPGGPAALSRQEKQ